MYFLAVIFFFMFAVKSFTFSKLHKNENVLDAFQDSLRFISYILIQQVVLFLFWLFLKNNVDAAHQIAIVGITFALFHAHFFFTHRKADGYMLTMASLIGGALFAHLYGAYYLQGLYIAFLIHIGFHALLDVVFLFYGGKPMKYYKK